MQLHEPPRDVERLLARLTINDRVAADDLLVSTKGPSVTVIFPFSSRTRWLAAVRCRPAPSMKLPFFCISAMKVPMASSRLAGTSS
jgi:hypothetical protein